MKRDKMKTKPNVYIAMPCYDSIKIGTMLSIVQLIQQLAKSGIKVSINTMKSPLIHQARNYLTSLFLTTEYTHMLFIDSDVEFKPEAILRMLVADKDICTTPYRVKTEDTSLKVYTIELEKDAKLEAGMVELKAGPTGLMLIKKEVFEKIIKNHPELKIKNPVLPKPGNDHKYYYNFFDFAFKNGYSVGEDVSFCQLAKDNGFRIYANTESETRHHGSYAWSGKFGESLNEVE
jgi:hypothetical protein